MLSRGVCCCKEVSLWCYPRCEISVEWTCSKCPPAPGLAGHYGDNTPCPHQRRPECGMPCVPSLPAVCCACFPPVARGSILPDIDHDSSVPLTFVRLPALPRYTHLLRQALPSSPPSFGQAKTCRKCWRPDWPEPIKAAADEGQTKNAVGPTSREASWWHLDGVIAPPADIGLPCTCSSRVTDPRPYICGQSPNGA